MPQFNHRVAAQHSTAQHVIPVSALHIASYPPTRLAHNNINSFLHVRWWRNGVIPQTGK